MMRLQATFNENFELRTRFGVIVLQSDEMLESDFVRWCDSEREVLHFSRIPNAQSVNEETLGAMELALPQAVGLLPPTAPITVIAYGCTSASMVMGEDSVCAAVQRVRPDVAVTNPFSAAKAWFKHKDARKIGLLAPYIPAVTQGIIDHLETDGFSVVAAASFCEEQDDVVARISEASIRDALTELAKQADCEALFASCTNLGTAGLLDDVAQQTGLPVTSSNAALWWHMHELAKDNRD